MYTCKLTSTAQQEMVKNAYLKILQWFTDTFKYKLYVLHIKNGTKGVTVYLNASDQHYKSQTIFYARL